MSAGSCCHRTEWTGREGQVWLSSPSRSSLHHSCAHLWVSDTRRPGWGMTEEEQEPPCWRSGISNFGLCPQLPITIYLPESSNSSTQLPRLSGHSQWGRQGGVRPCRVSGPRPRHHAHSALSAVVLPGRRRRVDFSFPLSNVLYFSNRHYFLNWMAFLQTARNCNLL